MAQWSQGVPFLIFEEMNLNRRVLAGVEAAGYINPTPIQAKAIPLALEGHDVLGLAQTGTGKTASFMLPILERLITGPLRRVRALILVPTRELTQQIYQTSVDLGKNTQIRSVPIYGGVSKWPQVKTLNRGVEIVVACPGRLLDHLNEGDVDLSRVEVLVLDEADTMCDMGFLPDIRRILKCLPERRQTLFFAATMPDEIRVLANRILHDPTTVQIDMIAPAKTVSHVLYPVTEALKKRLLLGILKQTATKRVIIFTRTKHRARRLAGELDNSKYRVATLEGDMSQYSRQQSIDGFRHGKYDLLVATDVASRGIQVSDVSHVINFDMPNTVDAYIHRIGRTGRMEKSGEAFTFILREDGVLVRQIESVLRSRIETRRLPDFDYGGFNPDRVTERIHAVSEKKRPFHRYSKKTQMSGHRRQKPGTRTGSKSAQTLSSSQDNLKGPGRRRFRRRRLASGANPARL